MIPKIEFRYSSVYDMKWPVPKDKFSKKFVDDYLKRIENLWKKDGEKILKEISKISGLKWKEKQIKVYFLSGGRCFSDPLTITYCKDKSNFIDILTHELIHQIQIQNLNEFQKWGKKVLMKKYSKESRMTNSHILLHAIHYKILEKYFGKKRLHKNIRRHKKFEDYKRAWQIVEEEGYEEIIKKFREIVKS